MTSTADIDLEAPDVTIRLRVPNHLADVIGDTLGDLHHGPAGKRLDIGWVPDSPDQWTVDGGTQPPATGDAGFCLASTLRRINDAVARQAIGRGDATIHAGAVRCHGRAVALIGSSRSGKSTATALAVRRGHGYLADEVVAVDPTTSSVRAYHRPIGLRRGGAAIVGVDVPERAHQLFAEVYPWRVGGGSLADDAPLAMLAFVTRRPGAAAIEDLSPGDALTRLVASTPGADGAHREVFRRHEHIARNVRAVELGYEDAADGLELIEAELE